MDVWQRLIRELALHLSTTIWLDRLPVVLEVWNEPNHHCFFRGTRQEYFELYEHTVSALHTVDPRFRVGGPATANFVPDDRFKDEEEDVSLHCNHTSQMTNKIPSRGAAYG